MKYVWAIIVVIALVLSVIPIDSQPVEAKEPSTDVTYRLGDNIKVKYTGDKQLNDKGQYEYKYLAVVDSAPIYYNNRLIDLRWYNDGDNYTAGHNLFTATIEGEKVTVVYDGHIAYWSPTVLLDGKPQVLKGTSILPIDPENKNYHYNTLVFDYGICQRHLRLIEGVLIEKYIFEANPKGTVEIKDSGSKSVYWEYENDIYAYDGKGDNIKLSGKLITAEQFNNAVYPIVLDPTNSFTTSSSDGYLIGWSGVYNTARTEASADSITKISATSRIRNAYYSDFSEYWVSRAYLYFDTSGLADNVNISSAILSVIPTYIKDDDSSAEKLQIQIGDTGYPHDPLVTTDYNYLKYSGNGGQSATYGNLVEDSYNNISLSATGLTWINPAGHTRFCLRGTRDINGNVPTDINYVDIYTYEKGAGYRPKLYVTYTASSVPTVVTKPASLVTLTGARLNGQLLNDGGEACDVRFWYGRVVNNSLDLGLPAIDRSGSQASGSTWINNNLNATINGTLGRVCVYPRAGQGDLTDFHIGTFYRTGGNTFADRDYINLGTIDDALGLQCYTVNITAVVDDKIGVYFSAGQIESYAFPDPAPDAGSGRWQDVGNQFGTGSTAYVYTGGEAMSFNGSMYIWLYNTTWDSGYNTGEYFYEDLEDLDVLFGAGATIDFMAEAENTQGNVTGAILNFTLTAGAGGNITNLIAIPNSHSVDLSWTKALGYGRTVIKYNLGDYPTDITDGYLVYNGTESSYEHTDLSSGVVVYYGAWGWESGNNSPSGAFTFTTTLAGYGDTGSPDTPDTPSNWFLDTSTDVVEYLPFFHITTEIADTMGMPYTTFWLILALFILIVVGLFTYSRSKNLLLVVILVMVGVITFTVIQILPIWIAFIYAIAAAGIAWREVQ